ncbi:hypothetical protein BH18ACI5_BH18ACI5_09220 [soil metagenome]
MTDSLRSDRHPASAEVSERERDARIEELLVTGLDHYFAEQHELAINVWTRVLFIDRGHARARAYIERARSAIGERLRKGDELLHTGVAAFNRGDAAAARELLVSAVEHGAPRDEALAVLSRIERLETAAQPGIRNLRPARVGVAWPSPNTAPTGARVKWIVVGLGAGTLLGAATIVVLVDRGVVPWPAVPPKAPVNATLTTVLPVPSLAEIALARAQRLESRGRLRDALDALEPIAIGDPMRARADELRTSVQRQLLAVARGTGPRSENAPRRP